MTTGNISAFWDWFTSKSSQIGSCLEKNNVTKIAPDLDKKIKQLFPTIGWEVGPGANSRYFLAFTLNEDRENLNIIQQILLSAPAIPNWEFRIGRPRRITDGKIRFRNSQGQEVEIDLRNWRYVLTEFDNGTFFDIAVVTSHRLRLDDQAKQQILRTAAQTVLGELDTLKYIDRMEFVEEPDQEWEKNCTPFLNLAQHIDALTMPTEPMNELQPY